MIHLVLQQLGDRVNNKYYNGELDRVTGPEGDAE